jgi:hypothetical protein
MPHDPMNPANLCDTTSTQLLTMLMRCATRIDSGAADAVDIALLAPTLAHLVCVLNQRMLNGEVPGPWKLGHDKLGHETKKGRSGR